jgi:thiamine biosynthesis lipoprotein
MTTEAHTTFDCFGSQCSVHVIGDGTGGSAHDAADWAGTQLLEWHEMFTRFDPLSELSHLNADPRHAVPVSPPMARFASLVVTAATLTGGLVDATMLREIEVAGYTEDLDPPLDLRTALATAPERHPAAPNPASAYRLLRVDTTDNIVFRPPGVMLDSGGLAKGLFCDMLAEVLATHDAYAVDCAGDVRIGGRDHIQRSLQVASPFEDEVIYRFDTHRGAAATSGIGRRSWKDRDGRPAHHLLDPSTGRPAYTGLVQATAFASTAAFAEIYAKAALLSGPEGAAAWLPYGGVLVHEDGCHEVVGEVVHA